jgi:hypothetical protein
VCFEVCPKRFSAVAKLSGEVIPPPPKEPMQVTARQKGKA